MFPPFVCELFTGNWRFMIKVDDKEVKELKRTTRMYCVSVNSEREEIKIPEAQFRPDQAAT